MSFLSTKKNTISLNFDIKYGQWEIYTYHLLAQEVFLGLPYNGTNTTFASVCTQTLIPHLLSLQQWTLVVNSELWLKVISWNFVKCYLIKTTYVCLLWMILYNTNTQLTVQQFHWLRAVSHLSGNLLSIISSRLPLTTNWHFFCTFLLHL